MNFQSGAHQSAFGSVNLSVAGNYEITYQGISDPSGNVADPKTRYIEVYDSTPPEIFLYGTNPVYDSSGLEMERQQQTIKSEERKLFLTNILNNKE